MDPERCFQKNNLESITGRMKKTEFTTKQNQPEEGKSKKIQNTQTQKQIKLF